MKKTRILAAMAMVGFVTASVRGESLDDVKKKIQSKLDGYKTIQLKMQTTTDMTSEQVSMKSDTMQTVQAARKGDKVLSRVDSVTKGETRFAGESQKVDSTTLSVCDGDTVYTYTESMGMKNAFKQKADKTNTFNPFDITNSFKILEQNFTIKLNADETVDGKPCWVIEMVMKNTVPGMGGKGKTLSYYEKSNGISLKSISYDEKGKVTTTSTTSDIKLNESIPPDQFVFKAPQGVEVVDQADLSKMGG